MYSGELALIVEKLQWDLGVFVEAYKQIPESIKVSFLLDVAYGLMYLHNRTPSVIHRDLSAGNVLISGEGKAKIADLGASKISSIQDVDIILLKEEVLKLQEQTRSQLELLKEVTTERDELKRSLEHVNARWDG